MSAARLHNDPFKYIRRIRDKYQARPFLEGVRYNLGLFDSLKDAREAINQFWWGKFEDLPKYTYSIRSRSGPRYFAFIRHRGQVYKLGPLATRGEASAAARMACVILFGDDHQQALRRVVKTVSPLCRKKKSLPSGQLQNPSSLHGRCGCPN